MLLGPLPRPLAWIVGLLRGRMLEPVSNNPFYYFISQPTTPHSPPRQYLYFHLESTWQGPMCFFSRAERQTFWIADPDTFPLHPKASTGERCQESLPPRALPEHACQHRAVASCETSGDGHQSVPSPAFLQGFSLLDPQCSAFRV